jgi:hypothetical protein
MNEILSEILFWLIALPIIIRFVGDLEKSINEL